jgi:electron transport complex protein RnfE
MNAIETPQIYLDNNATTRVDAEVVDAMLPYFTELFGNPSSMHSFASGVGKAVQNARQQIQTLLGAAYDTEIVFTSCGTESDSTAILSALRAFPDRNEVSLGMGLVSLMVFVISNLLVSMLRGVIPPEVRIPAFVLLIATVVTLVDLMMNAWLHELHRVLGLFIPLIVTNCAILGRAEAFAYKNKVLPSLMDGLAMGIGFTLALVILGACREVIGSGTLFANAHLLLGEMFGFMELVLIPNYDGFLLMILPPGAFLMLGFIVAGKRVLEKKLARETNSMQPIRC